MMDFLEYDKNLSSVKFSGEECVDRQFFINCIISLASKTKILTVYASRISKDVDLSLMKTLKLLNVSYEHSSIAFSIESSNVSLNLCDLLIEVWESFEQFSLSFFLNEKNSSTNVYWKSLVDNYQCFVVFKSIENDVLWLAQSISLYSKNLLRDLYDKN